MASSSDVEGLIDAVMNRFDTNFTLAGYATAAVLPATVAAWPVSDGTKTWACFVVSIKARALYMLNT